MVPSCLLISGWSRGAGERWSEGGVGLPKDSPWRGVLRS